MKYSLIFLLSPRDCLPIMPQKGGFFLSSTETTTTTTRKKEKKNGRNETKADGGNGGRIIGRQPEIRGTHARLSNIPEGTAASSALFFRLLFLSVGVDGAAAEDGVPLELFRWLPPPRSGVRSSSPAGGSQRISRSDEPVLKLDPSLSVCCGCCGPALVGRSVDRLYCGWFGLE